jgi:hypothetical protein
MKVNLQAANRLANAIFDKQLLSTEPVNATEQYDALPLLRKVKARVRL